MVTCDLAHLYQSSAVSSKECPLSRSSAKDACGTVLPFKHHPFPTSSVVYCIIAPEANFLHLLSNGSYFNFWHRDASFKILLFQHTSAPISGSRLPDNLFSILLLKILQFPFLALSYQRCFSATYFFSILQFPFQAADSQIHFLYPTCYICLLPLRELVAKYFSTPQVRGCI